MVSFYVLSIIATYSSNMSFDGALEYLSVHRCFLAG